MNNSYNKHLKYKLKYLNLKKKLLLGGVEKISSDVVIDKGEAVPPTDPPPRR